MARLLVLGICTRRSQDNVAVKRGLVQHRKMLDHLEAEVGRGLQTQRHQVAHEHLLKKTGTAFIPTDLLASPHGALETILLIL